MNRSPFTRELERWIVGKAGTSENPSIKTIQRDFRPAKSPDMSPLDYWFWGACETHLSKTKPDSIEQVMEHVNDYAASVPREQVDKAVMDILVRARCCLDCGGGSFEPRLKSFKRKNT